jgi:hypothetical protein
METAEMAETTMETDRDGSGGTSPSRQGARTETSIPRNLSSMAAALRNCSGKNADCFRVFRCEASYRRRGVIRSGPGAPHHRWARPGPGPHPLVVRVPSGPSPASVWSSSFIWARGVFELVLSNSENISCVAFLKHKNRIKQGSDTVASCQ